MFSALKFAAAGTVLALFGGLLLVAGVITPEDGSVTPAAPTDAPSPTTTEGSGTFPTGLFVATDRESLYLEFGEDGTGRAFLYPNNFEVRITYATNGDLWTEMTNVSPNASDRQVPATYYWDWDGELLSFELWGEELNPYSRGATMGHEYRLIPDAREALVAAVEIPAGEQVYSSRVVKRIIPGAEVPSDAFTSAFDVMDQIAADTIAEGQPITPDMLEPAAE